MLGGKICLLDFSPAQRRMPSPACDDLITKPLFLSRPAIRGLLDEGIYSGSSRATAFRMPHSFLLADPKPDHEV